MNESELALVASFENDIPLSTARAAHEGTSHVPEKRGTQERASYSAGLLEDYNHLRQQAEIGGTLELLPGEFARYRQGLREHVIRHLTARSRCISPMITGPANFPVARNRKRNDAADRRYEELRDFRKRALAAILRMIRPDLAPVRSSDTDAVERLKEELERLESAQATMKAANAAIRQHRKEGEAAQLAALMALGLSSAQAGEILSPNSFGEIGFASYSLSNNNASIRRVRARIEQVSRLQAQPVQTAQGKVARLEDDPPANRVRLFFPGKPDVGIRGQLKANGFRWTPSLGAWQAYRNPNSLKIAREVGGVE